MVRYATIGRRLARHAEQTGFVIETVRATTPVFLHFEDADRTLGLGRNMNKPSRTVTSTKHAAVGGSPRSLRDPSSLPSRSSQRSAPADEGPGLTRFSMRESRLPIWEHGLTVAEKHGREVLLRPGSRHTLLAG